MLLENSSLHVFHSLEWFFCCLHVYGTLKDTTFCILSGIQKSKIVSVYATLDLFDDMLVVVGIGIETSELIVLSEAIGKLC